MKIPSRLNTVLDWLSANTWRPFLRSPVLLACAAAPVCALVAFVSPAASIALTSLCLGGLLGWGVQASRLAATQQKLDHADVLIGALSEQNRRLVRGQVEENTLETVLMPKIGGGQ